MPLQKKFNSCSTLLSSIHLLHAATPRYLHSLTELRKVENFTTEVKRIERVGWCLATACFAILSRRQD